MFFNSLFLSSACAPAQILPQPQNLEAWTRTMNMAYDFVWKRMTMGLLPVVYLSFSFNWKKKWSRGSETFNFLSTRFHIFECTVFMFYIFRFNIHLKEKNIKHRIVYFLTKKQFANMLRWLLDKYIHLNHPPQSQWLK